MKVEVGRLTKERSHNLVFEQSEGGEILGEGLWVIYKGEKPRIQETGAFGRRIYLLDNCRTTPVPITSGEANEQSVVEGREASRRGAKC